MSISDWYRAWLHRECQARGIPVGAAKVFEQLDKPAEVELEVNTYVDAFRSISNRTFCASVKHQEQHHRADRKDCHPDILEFEKRFIARFRKLDVPFFAHCVRRDAAEQLRVFNAGHSKARYGQSPHNFGCAVDLIHGTKGWDIPEKSWRLVGHIGKEVALQAGIGIEWGGDFKSLWDPAHWQLANWDTRARIAGLMPPA